MPRVVNGYGPIEFVVTPATTHILVENIYDSRRKITDFQYVRFHAIFHDEVTVLDHALTRPWTVLKSYRRQPSSKPVWIEYVCAEANNHRHIGNENYMLSADGLLMPQRKGQPPPDLRYFNPSRK